MLAAGNLSSYLKGVEFPTNWNKFFSDTVSALYTLITYSQIAECPALLPRAHGTWHPSGLKTLLDCDSSLTPKHSMTVRGGHAGWKCFPAHLSLVSSTTSSATPISLVLGLGLTTDYFHWMPSPPAPCHCAVLKDGTCKWGYSQTSIFWLPPPCSASGWGVLLGFLEAERDRGNEHQAAYPYCGEGRTSPEAATPVSCSVIAWSALGELTLWCEGQKNSDRYLNISTTNQEPTGSLAGLPSRILHSVVTNARSFKL